jgi:Trk K+ transport system NAD-binding subunit
VWLLSHGCDILNARELPQLQRPQIIVCGLGRTGLRIFNLLRQQGATVVGISYHPMLEAGGEVVVGELRSPATLTQAGIHQAQTLVLATSDDALNLAILTQARILNPDIRIINRLFNISLGERLDHTLPHHVSLSSAALAAPLFAFAARGNRAIGQLRLFDLTWPMYEEVIDAAHPWHGKPLRALWNNRSQLLIHYHSARRPIDLVTAVVAGEVLQVGDRIVVATKPQQPTLKSRHVAQFWQRLLVTLDHGRRRARATLMVILALLITIGMATFTYLWHDLNTSWVDALYFSVGMITEPGAKSRWPKRPPPPSKSLPPS